MLLTALAFRLRGGCDAGRTTRTDRCGKAVRPARRAGEAACRRWPTPSPVPLVTDHERKIRGRFGEEDRILDVAIALEVFYGGKKGDKLAQRAAGLLQATVAEEIRTYERALGFYSVRSGIVHSNNPSPELDALQRNLDVGRALACRTLANLLDRNAPVCWAEVMKHLRPETRAHVAAPRRHWPG